MKSLLLFRDIKEFLMGVKEELGIVEVEKARTRSVTNLNVLGKFEFHIEIGPEHSAKITLGECLRVYNKSIAIFFKSWVFFG